MSDYNDLFEVGSRVRPSAPNDIQPDAISETEDFSSFEDGFAVKDGQASAESPLKDFSAVVQTKVFVISDSQGAKEYQKIKSQALTDAQELVGSNNKYEFLQIIWEDRYSSVKTGDYFCAMCWAIYTRKRRPNAEQESI